MNTGDYKSEADIYKKLNDAEVRKGEKMFKCGDKILLIFDSQEDSRICKKIFKYNFQLEFFKCKQAKKEEYH